MDHRNYDVRAGGAGIGAAGGAVRFVLFVCGIVGTGLLAVPVLAASACYGVGEACRWKNQP